MTIVSRRHTVVRQARLPADARGLAEVSISSATEHALLDPASYHVPELAAVTAYYERHRARTPTSVTLVADDGQRIVGAAEVRRLAAPSPLSMLRPIPTAIVELAVHRSERLAEVAVPLMEAVEGWAVERGVCRLQIDTLSANRRLLNLYRNRVGFRIAGVVLTKDVSSD